MPSRDGRNKVAIAIGGHLAATATEAIPVWVAPEDCTLTSALFMAGAAVTGANTNYTELVLDNGGPNGNGTTEIGNYDLSSGNNLVLSVGQQLLGTDGAGTDVALDEGDIVVFQYVKVGNGILVLGSGVVLEWEARQP